MELPGDDRFPLFGDQDRVVALVQELRTGALPAAESDRVVATVLATFDGPARAIRAAAAIRDELADYGLQVRVRLRRPRHAPAQGRARLLAAPRRGAGGS